MWPGQYSVLGKGSTIRLARAVRLPIFDQGSTIDVITLIVTNLAV